MDIEKAKYLYQEHGDLCLVGDDDKATVATLSKNERGFVIEFIDENNDMFFHSFARLDDALVALGESLDTIDGDFEFVY